MAANVTPTVSPSSTDPNLMQVTWVLTTAAETGLAFRVQAHDILTWQAEGTWGGATAALEGSNGGTVFSPLTNVAGAAAATFTADGMKSTNERPLYVRAKLTTVGVGATVNVTLTARRTAK